LRLMKIRGPQLYITRGRNAHSSVFREEFCQWVHINTCECWCLYSQVDVHWNTSTHSSCIIHSDMCISELQSN